MTHKLWLRVKLPADDLAALKQGNADCELRQIEDGEVDRQWLGEVEGVFTEEPLPDSLVQQMPSLRWLHVTRGGVNTYLTPAVKARPIQVTGSRGIHGFFLNSPWRAFSRWQRSCRNVWTPRSISSGKGSSPLRSRAKPWESSV